MSARPTIFDRSRVALERAIDQLPLYLGLRPEQAVDPIEAASQNRAFQFLLQLAKDLISATTVGDALERTLDIAFQALPVHRGFVMLRHDGGLRCEITRVRDHVERRPVETHPGSEAIIRHVMENRVGLYTNDALADERLNGADSVWRHGIRAAICVPLWSGEDVSGVLQVDSPVPVAIFNEHDLDFLMALANLAAIAVERIREREGRLRLQRYHAPAMVEQVLREHGAPGEDRPLQHADVTVLFADLAGSMALADSMSLEGVATMLSGFCARVAEAVFAEGGTVDKFIGDCVMAFFGAPVPMEDHAMRAVRAALRVQSLMAVWSHERAAAGLPPLRARVGLNSGPVIVGDIGSADRSDYTVIGTVVNVAARLEEDVAEPGDIVIGEATRKCLPAEFACEWIGKVSLRGLQHGVSAFRIRASGLESWHMAL